MCVCVFCCVVCLYHLLPYKKEGLILCKVIFEDFGFVCFLE